MRPEFIIVPSRTYREEFADKFPICKTNKRTGNIRFIVLKIGFFGNLLDRKHLAIQVVLGNWRI
jgi:hypothetical protein